MDFEGYGRSSRTEGKLEQIAEGVKIWTRNRVVMRETVSAVRTSSASPRGTPRAAFAMAYPDRVDRLVLSAFTYPARIATLADPREQVEFYRANTRRPRDRRHDSQRLTRDKPGTADPAVAEALADAELPFGDSVPTGTYLDMTANLPSSTPLKCTPGAAVRGEYDGIATEQDLIRLSSSSCRTAIGS